MERRLKFSPPSGDFLWLTSKNIAAKTNHFRAFHFFSIKIPKKNRTLQIPTKTLNINRIQLKTLLSPLFPSIFFSKKLAKDLHVSELCYTFALAKQKHG